MLQTIVVLVYKARKSTTQNHFTTQITISLFDWIMDWALIQDSYDAMNSLEDAILKSHSSSDLILGAEFVISHMITYHTSQEFLT